MVTKMRPKKKTTHHQHVLILKGKKIILYDFSSNFISLNISTIGPEENMLIKIYLQLYRPFHAPAPALQQMMFFCASAY